MKGLFGAFDEDGVYNPSMQPKNHAIFRPEAPESVEGDRKLVQPATGYQRLTQPDPGSLYMGYIILERMPQAFVAGMTIQPGRPLVHRIKPSPGVPPGTVQKGVDTGGLAMDLNEDRDKRSVSSATEEQPNQICMAGVIWHPIDGPRIVGMHKFREIHRGVDCLIFTYCEKGEGRGGSGLCWVDCEGLDIDNADDQFKWYKALIESGWANPNYFKAKGRVVMDNVQYPATQTKCVWELDGSEKEQESKIRRWPAAKEYQHFLYMARRSGSKDMIYYRRPAQPEYKMITDTFLGPHGVSSSKKAAAKKSPG